MSAVTEPAVAAATPTPPEEPTPTIVSPGSSDDGGPGQEEGSGDASKSSPGLSPSTWKPNADAAEWKPDFGAPPAAVPRSPSPVAGQGGGEEGEGTGGQRGKEDGEGAGKEVRCLCWLGVGCGVAFCVGRGKASWVFLAVVVVVVESL